MLQLDRPALRPWRDEAGCKLCGAALPPRYDLKKNSAALIVFECTACGFHCIGYLDRDPPSHALADAGELCERLDSSNERCGALHAMVRAKLEGGRLLDIGCGTGKFMRAMTACNFRCEGIEPHPGLAAHASRLGGTLHGPAIESAYWRDYRATFDAVTLWDVLEHVNDPCSTLKAVSHVLRPGGYLFLDTPLRDALLYRFGEITTRLSGGRFPTTLGIQYSPTPYAHKQIFRERDIRAALAAANFKVETVTRKFELSFPAAYYVRYFFGDGWATRVAAPIVHGLLRASQVRNKMVVVARNTA